MPTITYTPIPVVLLGQSGIGTASSGATTSPSALVQDYNVISLSFVSSTGSASNWSIQASNDDGMQSAIVNWSAITTGVTAAGIYSVAPGMRWLRVIRAAIDVSSTSNVTVILAGNAF